MNAFDGGQNAVPLKLEADLRQLDGADRAANLLVNAVDVSVVIAARLVVGNQRLAVAVPLHKAVERRVELNAGGELRVIGAEIHRVRTFVRNRAADRNAQVAAESVGDDFDVAPLVDEVRAHIHPVEATFASDLERVLRVDVDDREFDRFEASARLNQVQRHQRFRQFRQAGAEPNAVHVVASQRPGAQRSQRFVERGAAAQVFVAIFRRNVGRHRVEFGEFAFEFADVELNRVVQFRRHMEVGDELFDGRRERRGVRIFAFFDDHRGEIVRRIRQNRLIDQVEELRDVVLNAARFQDDAVFVDFFVRTFEVFANFLDALREELRVGEGAVEFRVVPFESNANRFQRGQAARRDFRFQIFEVGERILQTEPELLVEVGENSAQVGERNSLRRRLRVFQVVERIDVTARVGDDFVIFIAKPAQERGNVRLEFPKRFRHQVKLLGQRVANDDVFNIRRQAQVDQIGLDRVAIIVLLLDEVLLARKPSLTHTVDFGAARNAARREVLFVTLVVVRRGRNVRLLVANADLIRKKAVEPADLRAADAASRITAARRSRNRRRTGQDADVKALLVKRQLANVRQQTTFAARQVFQNDGAARSAEERLRQAVAKGSRRRKRIVRRAERPNHRVREVDDDVRPGRQLATRADFGRSGVERRNARILESAAIAIEERAAAVELHVERVTLGGNVKRRQIDVFQRVAVVRRVQKSQVERDLLVDDDFAVFVRSRQRVAPTFVLDRLREPVRAPLFLPFAPFDVVEQTRRGAVVDRRRLRVRVVPVRVTRLRRLREREVFHIPIFLFGTLADRVQEAVNLLVGVGSIFAARTTRRRERRQRETR